MADADRVLTYTGQPWLEAAWHAANPGVTPTPWDAPRPRLTRVPDADPAEVEPSPPWTTGRPILHLLPGGQP